MPSAKTVFTVLKVNYPVDMAYTKMTVTMAMAWGLRLKLVEWLVRAQTDRALARKINRRRSEWPGRHDDIDLDPAGRSLLVADMLSKLTPDTRFRPAIPKMKPPDALTDRQAIAAAVLQVMEPLDPAPWRFNKNRNRASPTAGVLIGIIYVMDRMAAKAGGKPKPEKIGPKAAAAALAAARDRRKFGSLR